MIAGTGSGVPPPIQQSPVAAVAGRRASTGARYAGRDGPFAVVVTANARPETTQANRGPRLGGVRTAERTGPTNADKEGDATPEVSTRLRRPCLVLPTISAGNSTWRAGPQPPPLVA